MLLGLDADAEMIHIPRKCHARSYNAVWFRGATDSKTVALRLLRWINSAVRVHPLVHKYFIGEDVV